MVKMTQQEIVELAAILVNEHGHTALQAAETRRAEHEPGSDSHRLWTRIAAEVAHLLGVEYRAQVGEYSS
jgi:hypothetical protein